MCELLKLVLLNACLGQIAKKKIGKKLHRLEKKKKKRGSYRKIFRETLCLHVTVVAPPSMP